ncbi:Ribosomal RNA-processing protein 7 [Tulasnella sp. 403]|nr:Ribosomal RNA-processing protein 7 [Tulasnella sp. 403]
MPKVVAPSSVKPRDELHILSVSYREDTVHHMSVCKYVPEPDTDPTRTLPEGRTLFVINVPPDATSRELSSLFTPCGVVERVLFGYTGSRLDGGNTDNNNNTDPITLPDEAASTDEDEDDGRPHKKRRFQGPKRPTVVPLPSANLRHLRPTGHTAHIIFLDESSLRKALSISSTPKRPILKWPTPTQSDPPLGLAHYVARYDSQRPPLEVIKKHADSSLALYDFTQASTAAERAKQENTAIVDEDGFTLVTRGGHHGSTVGGGAKVALPDFQKAVQLGDQNEAAARMKAHNDKTHKKNFYQFQTQGKKSDKLIDLRKKFEQDKLKIEKLKAKRKGRAH